jgi:serine/threonine-protein kinase
VHVPEEVPPGAPSPDAAVRGAIVFKDRYVVERKLGQGGMGVVYLGRDRLLDRSVAIKVIRPRDGRLLDRTRTDTGLREAFVNEAKIGANLVHPSIATVYDFGFHDNEPFTVFEYIEGQTLKELLRERGRLPLDEARLILGPLAQALEFAHARGVVHRDLKPDNVRSTAQGQFKILDLGLARQFRSEVDWRFAGTPAYASPEQAAGLPCDGRTDQYALALVAWEMLTGERPFKAHDVSEMLQMHRSTKPPDPRAILPNLPESVARALGRALEKDPNDRFESCQQFALAFGCQLLNAGVPVPVIEGIVQLDYLRGWWVTSRTRLTRRRSNLYLALGGSAVWIRYREELRRLSLGALDDLRLAGRKLRLHVRDGGADHPLTLVFYRNDEARDWHARLTAACGRSRPGGEAGAGSEIEPVVFLQRSPPIRYQSLGSLDYQDERQAQAKAGLHVMAAMAGADAIVDTRVDRVPVFDQSRFRLSGTAIRAVDSKGRIDLRARWFGAEVARYSFWMLMLVGVSMLFGLFALTATHLGLMPGVSPLVGQNIGSAIVVLVLIHAWPAAVVLALRWLRWPQLSWPATVTVVALMLRPYAVALGAVIGIASTGKWVSAAVPVANIVDPFGVAMLVFAVWLGRKGVAATRLYREIVPASERTVGPARTGASRAIMGLSVLFACGLVGVTSLGASFVTRTGVPGGLVDAFENQVKMRKALELVNQGARLISERPRESEDLSRRALAIWEDLATKYPIEPDFRLNLAQTLNNLGAAAFNQGRMTEAKASLARAEGIFDQLLKEFPNNSVFKERAAMTKKNLALVANRR